MKFSTILFLIGLIVWVGFILALTIVWPIVGVILYDWPLGGIFAGLVFFLMFMLATFSYR